MKILITALVKAKKAFSPALKGKVNPAFRSKYADLQSCLEAVNEALLDNGIALVQETSEDASGVTVETVFFHDSGESLRCGKLHVPAAKQDPQGYGSALSYARRYSLMTACGIAGEDDDGNAASKPGAKSPDLTAIAKSIAGAPNMNLLKDHVNAALEMLPEQHHQYIRAVANTRRTELAQHTGPKS